MPTAQLNVRVPIEHHNLIKNVAFKLRKDKEFAEALTAFVASVATSPVSIVADSSIASILSRLESVEAQLADLRQKPARALLDTVEPVAAADMPLTTDPLPEPSQKLQKQRRKKGRWTEADYAALRRIADEGRTQADAVHELDRSSSDVNKKWRELKLPVMPRKGRKGTPRRSSLPD